MDHARELLPLMETLPGALDNVRAGLLVYRSRMDAVLSQRHRLKRELDRHLSRQTQPMHRHDSTALMGLRRLSGSTAVAVQQREQRHQDGVWRHIMDVTAASSTPGGSATGGLTAGRVNIDPEGGGSGGGMAGRQPEGSGRVNSEPLPFVSQPPIYNDMDNLFVRDSDRALMQLLLEEEEGGGGSGASVGGAGMDLDEELAVAEGRGIDDGRLLDFSAFGAFPDESAACSSSHMGPDFGEPASDPMLKAYSTLQQLLRNFHQEATERMMFNAVLHRNLSLQVGRGRGSLEAGFGAGIDAGEELPPFGRCATNTKFSLQRGRGTAPPRAIS